MDITMCSYLGCPVRDKCKRATATPSEYQSYITNPSTMINGEFKCDLYWGDNAEFIWQELKSILGNGKPHKNKKK